MAKPILIIRFGRDIDPERANMNAEKMSERIGSEYHIFCVRTNTEDEVKFECLNDCKGLTDVDIEKLIKEFHV